jgi:hypothetical protein
MTLRNSIITFLFFTVSIFAQGSAGSSAAYEFTKLIDMPTTGVIEPGSISTEILALPFGVVIGKVTLSPFQNFSLGISYGGENIIGTGKFKWYKKIGLNAKLKLISDTKLFPGIAIGFNSQGKGLYLSDMKRYEIKSPGAFLAINKNYNLLGYLSLHCVINYSFEEGDNDKNFNLQLGFEKTIGGFISFVGEYDFAFNDDKNIIGKSYGYLNFGIRASISNSFTVGVDIKNILQNKNLPQYKNIERGLFVDFVQPIF